jgi:hypothetical protein
MHQRNDFAHRFQHTVLFGHILLQLIFDDNVVPQNHQHGYHSMQRLLDTGREHLSQRG